MAKMKEKLEIRRQQIAHSRVLELFDYDPSTGHLLRKIRISTRGTVGSIAGGTKVAYRYLMIDNIEIPLHHVVWFHQKGEWPKDDLAFDDRDPRNTRIENLVEQSKTETVAKGKIRSTNKSGVKGISWGVTDKLWQVHLYGNYGTRAVGSFKTIEEAKAALANAKQAALPIKPATPEQIASFRVKAERERLWRQLRKTSSDNHSWFSIDSFIQEVGTPPSPKHTIAPLDPTKQVGPANWQWVPPKFDRSTKEGVKQYNKHYSTINNERYREINLQQSFGITLDEYNDLVVEQNGVCAICERPETRLRRNKLLALAVDHNHATGKNRGLLCMACNTGIGSLQDNPDLLEKAADYIRKYKKLHEPKYDDNVVPIRKPPE